MTEATREVGSKQAQGQGEKTYYAAAFSGKMETYENIPRSEIKKLVQDLVDELLKGKIRSLYVSEG